MRTSKSFAPSSRESLRLELTGCVVDLDRSVAHPRAGGEPISLTTRECALLLHLAKASPAAVPRDELLGQVFGFSDATFSRACDNTVRRLREKIEVDASRPDHLLTVHGTGYRLSLGEGSAPEVAPVTAAPVRVDIVLGDVTVDLGRQRVYGPNGEQPLTATEVLLLARLLRAGGEVVDRLTLVREVWKQGTVRGREVDNAVRRLRNKIEADPKEPAYLLTAIRGGYKLVVRQTPSGRPVGGRLPMPRDRFVGRERELDTLAGWLSPESGTGRLVAVQGPVGVGKSRLALEAMRSLEPSFSGGVWVVELGAAKTEAEVCATVAATLGLQGADLERIGRVLGARGPTLVLLDNLDSVASVIGPIAGAWLSATPHPRFLLTSQLRLEADVEMERLVLGPLSSLEGSLLLSARGVRIDPNSEDGRSGAAARLVEALDGLPLALELAAARARVLSTRGLLSRLEGLSPTSEGTASMDRFRLLGDNRQQGLLASLDTSFALLTREERDAAARLSVFVGGFPLEAALEVLATGLDADSAGDEDVEARALELLEGLVDHSLLVREGERFQMLSSIRACAERHLTPDGRAQVVRAHGAFFAKLGAPALFERAERRDGNAVRAQLRQELPNLLAAAQRALAHSDREVASACALAVARATRDGSPQRTIELLEAVMALGGVPREAEIANCLANLLSPWRLPEQARAWASRAVSLAEDQGPKLRGRAIRAKGIVVAQLDGPELAIPLFQQALEESRRAGDRYNQGAALSNLGNVARTPQERIRYQTTALEVVLACEPRLTFSAQNNLALHLVRAFRIDEARDMNTRLRMTALGAGFVPISISATNNLGQLELLYGTALACETAYRWVLAAARDHGVLEPQFTAWQGLCALWGSQGRTEAAEQAMVAALDVAEGNTETLGLTYWFDLCMLRGQQRRFTEAEQCAERVCQCDPALGAYLKAELLSLRAPESEEGLAALADAAERCLERHPLPAWFALGKQAMMLALRGELPTALEALDQLESDPRHALVASLPGPGSLLLVRTVIRGHHRLADGDRAGAMRAWQQAQVLLDAREVDRQTTDAVLLQVLQYVEALRA